MRRLGYLIVFIGLSFTGCAGQLHEVITCDPPQADIYWGQTPSDLTKTEYRTPHSRSISGSSMENWCYQVKKDGFHDSDVKCRKEEEYRHLEFRLDPIKTTITSEPPGAIIHWGPSRDQITETIHRTPRTVYKVKNGASWKDWYYQVKKKGYAASEIVFLPQQSKDRLAHFDLKTLERKERAEAQNARKEPVRKETVKEEKARKVTVKKPVSAKKAAKKELPQGEVVSGTQATLAWDDQSSNELGFKIERKTGADGAFSQIATVGPNVTSYRDTELRPGMTYFYRVRAYNAHGHSAYSGEIRVNVLAK